MSLRLNEDLLTPLTLRAEAAAERAETAEGNAETAQAATEAARDLALAYGSATIYATWTELAAATGMSAGDVAQVVSSDTGTHTDPVVGGTVANSGVLQYSADPAGWERIADLESDAAANSATAADGFADAAAASAVLADTAADRSEAARDIAVAAAAIANEGIDLEEPGPWIDADKIGFLQSGAGAVARTAQAKLRERVSVFDYMSPTLQIKVALRTATVADAAATRAAVQAAVDAVIYNDDPTQSAGLNQTVYAPAGLYYINDTIHLGYGTGFNSVTFEGDTACYRGEAPFNGAVFITTFSDRPAFNFQGSRISTLRGIAIKGLLASYIQTNNLAAPNPIATPSLDDTVAANWNDPALASTQDSRYAPYAAITVDAYSGTRPGTSYPNVAYPAFLGTVAQYGKNFSSDVLIEDVYIQGFNTAVVVQPCDADGNGDFVKIRRCYFEQCKYGISIGNSQSRNVSIDGLVAHQMYSIFTNSKHGRQIGKFGSNIRDLSAYWIINLFEFGSYYAGPMTFDNCYIEAIWRIGTQLTSAQTEVAINFNTSEFYFTLQDDVRGVPADVLSNGGGSDAGVVNFNGCTFWGYPSIAGFNFNGVTFIGGTQFRCDTRTALYEKFAHNATCGGLITRQLANPESADLKTTFYDLDTGGIEGTTRRTSLWRNGTRKNCIPLYATNVGASEEPYDSFPNKSPYFRGIVNKSEFSSLALVNKTLTGTFSSRADWQFMNNGPLPGDVIWDDQTGMSFFVRSRTGTTFIAEAQNNYKSNGSGGFVPIASFSTTVGNFYIRNTRLYTPRLYLRGDTTAGNATATNVGRDDGFGAWYDAQIAVGDAFAILATQDRWQSDATAFISARDQSAGTITMSAGAEVRASTRRRFDLFIRTGPSNV